MKDMCIVSVWKNHENPKNWIYDVCEADRFFKGVLSFLIETGEPYYYSPLFYGTREECNEFLTNLRYEIEFDFENWKEQNVF